MPSSRSDPEMPRLAAALLRLLLPHAEREEVLEELAAEHRARAASLGERAARRWVWRQVLVSAPALAGRGWWRGWSGFETRSERMQPGGAMFENWARDIRYTLRRLRRRPAYTGLTVLTLALGVAGTASVFGVAKRLLLEPLPVPAEEQVVVFWFEGAWSEQEFDYLRPELTDFENVAAFRSTDATLQLGDAPAQLIRGVSGSAELFQVLGVTPARGTGFRPGDDQVGSEPVVVLSHSLWRDLGARPSILGERLELSGVGRTVVGVMPPGFWFPDPTVQVWLSEVMNPEDGSGNWGILARMPPGVTTAGMAPQLDRITTLLDERYDFPEEWDLTKDPELIPLRDRLVGSVRPALLALLGGMALILLIACVNVAALMLGQVDSRGTELAVRSALGAGRGRLLRQLVVESVVVGLLAGVAGAALALVGFRFLVGALPLGALADAATVDWTLFTAAMALAIGAATAVALAPGISIARSDLQRTLTRIRTGGIGGRGGVLERGLVVAQVALVLLLASGAALLIRSVGNLRAIDPGVDVEDIAVLQVLIPVATERERWPSLVAELVAAAEALPGVASAGITQKLPLVGSGDNWGIGVEGNPELANTTTAFRVVTPDYFETMGVRVEEGRGLLSTDRVGDAEEGTVVINRALAEKYFPGENPLGRRIAFMNGRWDRIVGVVENVAESELSPEPVPARYMVHDQVPWLLPMQTLVLRARPGQDATALLDPARRAIQAAAPGVAVREVTTMESVFDRSLGPALQVMALMTLLAGLALTLGAIGIYGVVSHFVTRRRRDWGIRIALGLRPAKVTGQIVGSGGTLVGAGIVLGLAGFLLLARLLGSFLYGVGTADPLALAGATAILLAAGLLAAYVPARRASRIDPARVLREQ